MQDLEFTVERGTLYMLQTRNGKRTAKAALKLGARIVNDVWSLQRDPAMAETIAEAGAGLVMMHNREGIDPDLDIVADMERFFARSLELATRAGIPLSRIALDPGIGFGKNADLHQLFQVL